MYFGHISSLYMVRVKDITEFPSLWYGFVEGNHFCESLLASLKRWEITRYYVPKFGQNV